MTNSRKKTTPRCGRAGPSKAKLDEMIAEAIVDAHGQSEQTLGFYTMLDDNQIAAVCSRRRSP